MRTAGFKKAIAYYRVSTKRQGASGLGIAGQKDAVETFAESQGATIVAVYTEVESGKVKTRPALLKAIAHAKAAKATLVVAKLDRLARSVAFTSALMESGVDFIACDNPHANRLTIHILAAVAEDEARNISSRTKAALQVAKRRGQLLGSARPGHWDGKEDVRLAALTKARKEAAESKRAKTKDVYAYIQPEIKEMRESGESLRAIAEKLNAAGHTTSTGKPWTGTAVLRVSRM